MLETFEAFRTGLHSLLATDSTQLMKELEACLGPLPHPQQQVSDQIG